MYASIIIYNGYNNAYWISDSKGLKCGVVHAQTALQAIAKFNV